MARQVRDVGRPSNTYPRLKERMRIDTLPHGVKHTKFLDTEVCSIPLVQEFEAGDNAKGCMRKVADANHVAIQDLFQKRGKRKF